MRATSASAGLEAPIARTNRLKERAALASIAVSSLLTVAKFVAGLASGSLAVLSEAGHNLADVAATTLTYFAIRIANKPADDDHQFGHAKVEALAALVQTGFLFALAVYIFFEAVARLASHDTRIEANFFAFAVLMTSIVVDLARWLSLKRIAATTKSDALGADALHFSSDIVSSSLALCGLAGAHYGYPQGDALASLGLVAFIAGAGLKIGRRTVNALVDTAPRGLASQVRSVARSVPGVVKVETLRLRPAGAEVVGDVGITVSRTLPLEHAAAIEANVASAIAAKHPEVAVKVAAQPTALDDETILERVLLVAAKRRVPIHHVTIQEIDGRVSISFDVELDGGMTHGNAHETVSGLELEIRHELGHGIEVESHIEPLVPRQLHGHDVPEGTRAEISSALIDLSVSSPIRDVHNVRVRTTPDGLVVNYHCRVSPCLTVDEVHSHVDELDRKMRGAFTGIVRIVGHAEPLRA
ncbi:MAG: cation-efflux pump [Beijerinckiaceae bacterium]|nr:cation-efflux pump [Beijerinckiaceae bacterium]